MTVTSNALGILPSVWPILSIQSSGHRDIDLECWTKASGLRAISPLWQTERYHWRKHSKFCPNWGRWLRLCKNNMKIHMTVNMVPPTYWFPLKQNDFGISLIVFVGVDMLQIYNIVYLPVWWHACEEILASLNSLINFTVKVKSGDVNRDEGFGFRRIVVEVVSLSVE